MQINKIGVKVQHIQGGCTGLFQPVDVRISICLEIDGRHG